jgi:hypothetical protein
LTATEPVSALAPSALVDGIRPPSSNAWYSTFSPIRYWYETLPRTWRLMLPVLNAALPPKVPSVSIVVRP